jgi:hypothetical protein
MTTSKLRLEEGTNYTSSVLVLQDGIQLTLSW